MDVNSIAGVRSTATATQAHKTTLDQSDFLTLMTAQLKNQDPTSPVDNSQYVSQMAQFSQVTGVTATNTKLDTIAAKLDALIAAQPKPAAKSAITGSN